MHRLTPLPLLFLWDARSFASIDNREGTRSGRHGSNSNPPMNTSFLLIKPEACTAPFIDFASHFLEGAGLRIDDVTVVTGEEVAQRQLASQHYATEHQYAMADSARLNDLIHNRDEVKATFFAAYHELWDTAMEEGRILTAKDAMAMLGNLNAKELSARWYTNGDFLVPESLARVTCSPVKLLRGMCVMRLAKEHVYVINGHYPALNESFTNPEKQVCRLSVSWPESRFSWSHFLQEVIGAPDPDRASPTSLRYALCNEYPQLGIATAPTIAQNGFDVAKSPLESLAYRRIWTRRLLEEDEYGRVLLQEGVPYLFVERVLTNPVIIQAGEVTCPFDLVLCKSSSQTIRRLAELYAFLKGEDERLAADSLAERRVFVFDDASRPCGHPLSLPTGCQEEIDAVRNTALVLVKPHADHPNVFKVVKELLSAQIQGLTFDNVVDVDAALIRTKDIVNRHYRTISFYASRCAPADIEVDPAVQQAFEGAFGVQWAHAVTSGHVWNADAALHMLGGISPTELLERWNANTQRMKLCSGAYVCRFAGDGEDGDTFVINGFYPHVSAMFTAPTTRVRCYVISWPEKTVTWETFRNAVVGNTDPAKARASSIRGVLASRWMKLGLKHPLNMTENGIHASASPLEAAVERHLWLGTPLEQDTLSTLWSRHGISPAQLMRWTTNPIIENKFLGEKKRVFDMAENMQTSQLLRLGREAELATLRTFTDEAMNRALVLLHPHAATTKAIALVQDVLARGNITVIAQGDYYGTDASSRVLDTPSMRAVAKYAALGGEELFNAVPADAKVNFYQTFGKHWEFDAEIITGADVACADLDVTTAEMMKKFCDASPVRIARHCHVAFVKSYQRYIVNGFYPFVAAAYHTPGARVHYLDVEWKESEWAWEDFNKVVIGHPSLSESAAGSLQRSLSEAWRELGMQERPCHRAQCSISASAGPLEAIADRVLWLPSELTADQRFSEDSYTQRLLMEGIPRHLVAYYAVGYKTVYLRTSVDQERAVLAEVSVGKQSSECSRRLLAVAAEIQRASKMNYSFLWVHPSSAKDGFELELPDVLTKHGVQIRSSGQLTLGEATVRDLINSPFTSLYRNAYVRTSSEVTISTVQCGAFKDAFGITWETAVQLSLLINAKEAVDRYGETYVIQWWDQCTNKVCLSPHLYVGHMEREGMYVINGFYPYVRARLHNGSHVLWYSVSWDPRHLSWEDFLRKVVGDEDPPTAEPGSLRRHLYDNWERYGLNGPPDAVENGVHASANPMEALAERCLWRNTLPEEDVLGQLLLKHGVHVDFLRDVLRNPVVHQQFDGIGDITELFNLLPEYTADLESLLLAWQHSHTLSLLPEGTIITNPKPNMLTHELNPREREARQLLAVLQQALHTGFDYPSPLESLMPTVMDEDPAGDEEDYCSDPHATKHRAYAVLAISPLYTSTPQDCALIRQVLTNLLRDHRVRIVIQGAVTGVTAEDHRIFDVQHRRLVQFATKFTWQDVTAYGALNAAMEQLFGETFAPSYLRNAIQIQEEFDLTAKQVNTVWHSCQPIVHVAPDVFVGKVPSEDLFIVNGFVPHYRDAFYNINHNKHFLVVRWDDRCLSYNTLLTKVIGDNFLVRAEPHSLHGILRDQWSQLGFTEAPHPCMGVVHASDSALSCMQHRQLWMSLDLANDPVARISMAGEDPVSPFVLRWATTNPTMPDQRPLFAHTKTENTATTLQRLHRLETDYRSQPARNTSLIVVKPHALGRRFARRLEHVLEKHAVRIEEEGDLSGHQVHERSLLRYLYPSVAGYAVRNPASIVLTGEEQSAVEAALDLTWPELVYGGVLLNAYVALERLGNITPQQLYVYWKASRTRVRVRPDMEVTALEDYGIFVVNGFFPAFKESFESPRALLHWYVVSWEEGTHSWEGFLANVVGDGEPAKATASSIRGQLYRHWREYGLHSIPDRIQNGVHVSSGPWHAMAERLRIVQPELAQDVLGDLLVRHKVHSGLIDLWLSNPDVVVDGVTAGVFEHLTCYNTTPLVEAMTVLSNDLHRLEALRTLEKEDLLELAVLTHSSLLNAGKDTTDEEPPDSDEEEGVFGASWRSAPQPDEDPLLYRNTAMLVLKPHLCACTAALRLLRSVLQDNSVRIVSESFQDSSARLVDRLYFTEAFFALHSCVVRVLQEGVDVSRGAQRRFGEMFGEAWETVAAADGRLLSAAEAMHRLRLSAEQLYVLSTLPGQATLAIGHHLTVVKLLDADVFVVNATYPYIRQRMEQSESGPQQKVGAFVVAFDERLLTWKAFRAAVIGAVDPAEAAAGSFRARLLAEWEALGMPAPPTAVENGLRESQGAVEAFAERRAWFGRSSSSHIPDALTRSLCMADVDPMVLETWAENPLVEYTSTGEGEATSRTVVRRLFDLLYECSTRDVISLVRRTEEHPKVLSTVNNLRRQEELSPHWNTFKPQAPRMHPPLPPLQDPRTVPIAAGPTEEPMKVIADSSVEISEDGAEKSEEAVTIPYVATAAKAQPRIGVSLHQAKVRDALLNTRTNEDVRLLFNYYLQLDPPKEHTTAVCRAAPGETINCTLFKKDYGELETFGVPLPKHLVHSVFSAAEACGGRMRYDEFARAIALYRAI